MTASRKRLNDLEIRRNIALAQARRLGNNDTDLAKRIELKAQVDFVENELNAVEPKLHSIDDYLDYITGVLNHPERFVSSRKNKIFIDRMGIKHKKTDKSQSVYRLDLSEIIIAGHRPRVAELVHFPKEELLPEKNFLHESCVFGSPIKK